MSIQAQTGQQARLSQEENATGPSGRVSASHGHGPGFPPQHYEKGKAADATHAPASSVPWGQLPGPRDVGRWRGRRGRTCLAVTAWLLNHDVFCCLATTPRHQAHTDFLGGGRQHSVYPEPTCPTGQVSDPRGPVQRPGPGTVPGAEAAGSCGTLRQEATRGPCPSPRHPASWRPWALEAPYLALTVSLELCQLQGDFGVLAACEVEMMVSLLPVEGLWVATGDPARAGRG